MCKNFDAEKVVQGEGTIAAILFIRHNVRHTVGTTCLKSVYERNIRYNYIIAGRT